MRPRDSGLLAEQLKTGGSGTVETRALVRQRDADTLATEAARYLSTVDVFRFEGCAVEWHAFDQNASGH